MEIHRPTPPASVIKMLSKRGGKDVAKGLGTLLGWAESQTDHSLSRRSLQLVHETLPVLKAATPDVDPELVGEVVAALADLWAAGRKLDKDLKAISKFRLPRDRARLRRLLIEIEAHQLDEPEYWISVIRKRLPKLYEALDRKRRKSRVRRRRPGRVAKV